jgi:magnesium-transporting ATPase (P-type)
MSILVQDPEDKQYKLYCKGADSIIMERLLFVDPEGIKETESFLKRASLQGLRTLMFAMKVLSA